MTFLFSESPPWFCCLSLFKKGIIRIQEAPGLFLSKAWCYLRNIFPCTLSSLFPFYIWCSTSESIGRLVAGKWAWNTRWKILGLKNYFSQANTAIGSGYDMLLFSLVFIEFFLKKLLPFSSKSYNWITFSSVRCFFLAFPVLLLLNMRILPLLLM